ncbi:MAG: efflux RND transporter periplasmic adaptor subunit [Planctomycetes bacterium]|nr:efflux RND transporter periplasmic adaptor subunit [Planctomycetota bacterium]
MTKNRYIILGAVAVLGLIAIRVCSPTSPKAEDRNESLVRPIPTAVAQPLAAVLVREFPGRVRATRRVNLAFSVNGQLKELNALEGRKVKKGEVIARLDDRDYRNSFDAAKASYADAKRNFDRTKVLREKKVVPEADFDSATAAYDMAKADMKIREKALEDTVLLAPFDGIIATRLVENHEHIQAKQTIVSIQDISCIEVILQVPERLVAHGGAKSLSNINVRLDADGGRWFKASVQEFSVQADPVTRTYELILSMDAPKDISIFPGMTANVKAEVIRHNPVKDWNASMTIVPANAVATGDDGGFYVWVIEEKEGHPKRAKVEVGAPRDNGIEIRSGLKAGDRVAIAGLNSLDETMLVRPMRDGGEGLDG